MNKNDLVDSLEYNSKRRKTAHTGGDNTILINPMKIYDLNNKTEGLLEKELNNYNPEIDFMLNSHKKRTFAKIDKEDKMFVSKIPKPTRNARILFSKYSNNPTLIPRFTGNNF